MFHVNLLGHLQKHLCAAHTVLPMPLSSELTLKSFLHSCKLDCILTARRTWQINRAPTVHHNLLCRRRLVHFASPTSHQLDPQIRWEHPCVSFIDSWVMDSLLQSQQHMQSAVLREMLICQPGSTAGLECTSYQVQAIAHTSAQA